MPSVVLSAWHGEGAVGFAGLEPGSGAGRSKCSALVPPWGLSKTLGGHFTKLKWHIPVGCPRLAQEHFDRAAEMNFRRKHLPTAKASELKRLTTCVPMLGPFISHLL